MGKKIKKKIKPHQEFNLLIQITRRDLAWKDV
jgi:hypothetical protein